MLALPFNASDSIQVLYGIHAGVSPACCRRRRLVGVGLPCSHANGSTPDEMTRFFEQGALSSQYNHVHPLSTSALALISLRIQNYIQKVKKLDMKRVNMDIRVVIYGEFVRITHNEENTVWPLLP